jgi:hypothetical protein
VGGKKEEVERSRRVREEGSTEEGSTEVESREEGTYPFRLHHESGVAITARMLSTYVWEDTPPQFSALQIRVSVQSQSQ